MERNKSIKAIYSLLIINIVGLFGMHNVSAQDHFVTVWDGENGFGHMNIYIVTAALDGQALQTGDEIAVFSGDLCVGAVALTEPSGNDLINMVASLDDGTGNGFLNGDTILFKVWDKSDQAEKFVKRVNYRNDVSTWFTNGRYGFNESSFVDLVIESDYKQNISLTAGWNIFSGNVLSSDPDMKKVMDSLITAGDLIKIQDEKGGSLENVESLGGWNNNIGDMKSTEGYKIKVLNDCNLSLKGIPVAVPLEIPLTAGWNIISFPLDYAVDAKDVFHSLIDNGALEKVKDERGNSLEDWGIYGGWINNIGSCIPGEGYEVSVSRNVTLTISAQYTKSQDIYSASADPVHFTTVYEGNGLDHMNLNILSLAASDISVDDEIAIFDNSNCVGVLKITDDHIANNIAVVNAAAAYAEDPGFEEGDVITYKVWKANEGIEYSVDPVYLKGQQTFTKHESSFVRLNTVLSDDAGKVNMNVNVYPNPTNGMFSVNVSHQLYGAGSIEVYDVAGKIIESRDLNSTVEKFDFTGKPLGVYLVKTSIGDSTRVDRVVLRD